MFHVLEPSKWSSSLISASKWKVYWIVSFCGSLSTAWQHAYSLLNLLFNAENVWGFLCILWDIQWNPEKLQTLCCLLVLIRWTTLLSKCRSCNGILGKTNKPPTMMQEGSFKICQITSYFYFGFITMYEL